MESQIILTEWKEFGTIGGYIQAEILHLLQLVLFNQRWDIDENEGLTSQIVQVLGQKVDDNILPSLSTALISPSTFSSPLPSVLSDELIVIGAGQMRTGTTSLKAALQMLYNQPCYHMSDVVNHYKESHIQKWLHLFNEMNKSSDKNCILNEAYWKDIYGECKFAVDYPTCLFYKELMKIYPNAKVILTIRGADSWVSSCRATTASDLVMKKHPSFTECLIYRLRGIKSLPKLHDKMFSQAFGTNYDTMTNDELKQVYLQWNQNVIDSVPSDRLLVFNLVQGWEPLCEFLQIPVPQDINFPHLNKGADMRRNLLKYRYLAQFMNFLIVGSFSMLIWFIVMRII
ncbi:unnamed protein product [Heterobilharzia americana]|nr:unnamed protein product [Heterobilharzia americana]